MANNYAPLTNPGDTRIRIHEIRGHNPNSNIYPELAPSLDFLEEEVCLMSDMTERVINKTFRGCTLKYDDPEKLLPLRNPVDDTALDLPGIGSSISMAFAFTILYSLGRLAQAEKDAKEAAEQALLRP